MGVRSYMTVRELINKLLDFQMDEMVYLFTVDPERPECRGVAFDIYDVISHAGEAGIHFTDWRDEVDKRERGAK